MTEHSRKLAAIMYTDVVGYTKMMQKDEPGTINRLERYKSILHDTVEQFEGKITQYYGDGCLIIFNSVINASLCGIKIQESAKDSKLPLRIGIHVGELFLKNGNIYGDGLNIASRLESLGIEGSVLISGSVFDLIHNQPYLKTRYLGKYRVKNVVNPLQVYSIANQGIPVPDKKNVNRKMRKSGDRSILIREKNKIILSIVLALGISLIISSKLYLIGPSKDDEKSIVIIPFINLNSGDNLDNFSEGITEDIQTQVTKIHHIKIIPLESSSIYKGGKNSIQEIEKTTDPSFILKGSIRKSRGKIRVFAELIETGTNRQIWSETYDRDSNKVLKIQNEIAVKIASALKSQLSLHRADDATYDKGVFFAG